MSAEPKTTVGELYGSIWADDAAPIAHQTNLMVMGPGGYSTTTFVRFGIPVTVVARAVSILMGWALLT